MPPKANLSDDEKRKWGEILKYFKSHPEMLLEMMPENVHFKFQNKNSLHRKGQSLIPDLGVVPPQSGHLGPKQFEKEHLRNKSYGELRKAHNQMYNQQLNPIVAKYSAKDNINLRPNNTPNGNPTKHQNPYFKPNTANQPTGEYQTPSFLTNNILNTVNKTVYKVNLSSESPKIIKFRLELLH